MLGTLVLVRPAICAQCPIWLLSVVPCFRAFTVCRSGIVWMMLIWFQSPLLLRVLHSTCAERLLRIFSASLLIIFLSTNTHVPSSLPRSIMSGFINWKYSRHNIAKIFPFICCPENNDWFRTLLLINSVVWVIPSTRNKTVVKVSFFRGFGIVWYWALLLRVWRQQVPQKIGNTAHYLMLKKPKTGLISKIYNYESVILIKVVVTLNVDWKIWQSML